MKKKISAVLALIMLICTLAQTGVFAEQFSDVTDENPYQEAIISLSMMGVIKGYDENGKTLFKPDNNITRAEFAVLMTRLLNIENITYTSYDFDDVSGHYAKDQIQTIYKKGIINGYGDGKFGPDDNITYEQAIKMMVGTLGYSIDAETFGGYPDGYITQAQNLKITKDINAVYTQPATRGVVSQLIFNALEINIKRQNSENGYTVTDENIMEDYLRIYRQKGLVVGIGDSVTEDNTVKLAQYEMGMICNDLDDELVVNFTTYNKDITQISQYLGKTVTVYYREYDNTGEKELLNIDAETVKNTVTEISSKDMISYNDRQLKYYDENERQKTLKLDNDEMSVIYNGKVVKRSDTVNLASGSCSFNEALAKWLNPDDDEFITGEIKATDSSSNGIINLLTITDYDVMVAKSAPTTTDYRLTDILISGNYMILDPESKDYTYTVSKNGADIKLTQISANDVVQYAKSLDGELYTLVATSKTVSGVVTSMADNSDIISIDNKEYTITDTCRTYLAAKGYEVTTGSKVSFHVDKYDSLIFGTVSAAEVIPYGILITGSIDESNEGKGYLSFYSPTNNTSKTSMELADSVKIDGKKMSPESAVETLRNSSSAATQNQDVDNAKSIWGGEVKLTNASQIARVGTSGGKVTTVITAGSEYGTNNDDSKLVKYQDLKQLQYSSTNKSFGDFYVDTKTTILFVPQDRSDKTSYKKFSFSNGTKYWVEAYNVNSSKTAELVVVYGKAAKNVYTDYNTKYSVVSKAVYEEINTDDDKVQKFKVYSGGKDEVTVEAEDTTKFADVAVGDIIQYASSDGKAAVRKDIFNIEDISEILDGKMTEVTETVTDEEGNDAEVTKSYKYAWTDSKFSFKYSTNNTSGVPYSRAIIANVLEMEDTDGGVYMHVTQNGFDADGNVDASNEERYMLSSDPAKAVPIVRVDRADNEVSPYVEGTETLLTIDDLKDIKYFKEECSKVMLYIAQGNVKFMVIYE